MFKHACPVMDDDSLALVAFVVIYNMKLKNKKRKMVCKERLKKRNTYSHTKLLRELKIYPRDWHNYLRMDEKTYLSTPFVSRDTFNLKKRHSHERSYNPQERLIATSRFLATGRSYEYLKYSTIISPQAA